MSACSLAMAFVLVGCGSSRPAATTATPAVPATPVAPAPEPRGPVDPGWRVSRVVDGDTVWVTRDGERLKVRLIGIDTPETVDPDEPVGCFGPESSAYAASVLSGRAVTLEYDPSQGQEDVYGRTLAYLWLTGVEPGTSTGQYNLDAVRAGYAREYLYDEPYAWRTDFVAAEDEARSESRGLWAACPDAT